MADIQNPSFESAGTGLGQADKWSFGSHAAEGVAAFDGGLASWDDFEVGWSNDAYAYVLVVSAAFTDSFTVQDYVFGLTGVFAFFNSGANPRDDFEAWLTSAYLTSLASTSTAMFDSGVNAFDSFASWVVGYIYSLAGTVTAAFNVEAAQTTTSAQPYAFVDGDTLTIAVDGGAPQTVTFHTADAVNLAAATAAEVAAAITDQLNGARAYVDGNDVVVKSTKDPIAQGKIQVTGGSGNAGILDFPTSLVVASTQAFTNFEVGWGTMTTI